MKLWVGLLLALVASPVLAGSDTFYLGTGRDGALEVSQPETRINRYAQVKAPLATGDVAVQVDSAEGFAAGELVMVLQTTGLVPAAVPGRVEPMVLSQDAVGRWELARVYAVDGDVLSLRSPLLYSYAAEVSQVIRVPELTSVHVLPGASLVAQPWNGATGGVLAFLATGTVLNEGRIDVSGMGFSGGSPTWQEKGCSSAGGTGEGVDSTAHGRATGPENVANGGGGGSCHGRAGGGGGNASAGGQAGMLPWGSGGKGGASLVYSLLDHLTFGGGGGGGSVRGEQLAHEAQGGRGGGAIFIRAGGLDGSGAISASGEAGGFSVSDGPGGGGAGGSILLRLAGPMRCGGLHAEGGRGGASLGSSEPVSGGGGGAGRVLYQSSSVTGCPISAGAGLSDSWSEVPAVSGEESVTVLPGGLIRPEPATIVWPGDGSTVDTSRPAILGRAMSGMDVIVYLDGAEAGRVVAADGVFSFTPTLALTAGNHIVQAETSYQGLQSERSSLHSFVVSRSADATRDDSVLPMAAPKVPKVTSIAGRSSSTWQDPFKPLPVGTLQPPLVGTSDPNTTVEVKIYGRDSLTGLLTNLEQTLTAKANGDSCPGGSCDWVWTATPYKALTTDGLHGLVVTATNTDGTSNPSFYYYFTIDEQAPTAAPVVSSGFPQLVSNNLNPTIKGTFAEKGKVLISIDGVSKGEATVASAGAEWNLGSVAVTEGSHLLQAVGQDEAGNPSPSASVRFTVDKTPPSAPTVTHLGGVPVPNSTTAVKINTTTPGIKGFAEPNSTVVVKRSDNSATVGNKTVDGSGVWEFTALAAVATGTLPSTPAKLLVTVTDNAGNPGAAATEVLYFVDQSNPTLKVLSVGSKTGGTGGFPDGTSLDINLKRPSITGELNEPGRVTVTLTTTPAQTLVAVSPAGTNGAWRWSVDPTSDLADGQTYTLTVNSEDEVGRTASASYTLKIDWTAPQTTLGSCPDRTSASAPYNFSFGVESPDTLASVSFQCSLDGAEYGVTPCSSTYSIESVKEGDHVLLARAVDKAGNVDATPVGCFWNVSNAEFQISIDKSPAELSRFSTALFALSSNRTPTEYQCQLIKSGETAPVHDWRGCSASFEYTGLTDGSYTLSLSASAGIDLDTASFTWTVDLSKPASSSIDVPAADGLFLRTQTPSLQGKGRALPTDRPSEPFYVQVYIDEDVDDTPALKFLLPGNKEWQTTLPRQDDGSRYVWVVIRDEAGNLSGATKRQFFVDTDPPDTAFVSTLPDKLTNQAFATFGFGSPSDATGIEYECNLDDVGFASCENTDTFPHETAGFTGDQTHTLQVRAKDRAGNVDPSPAQYTWRVDRVEPDTFVESGPRPLTNSSTASFVFRSEAGATFECALDTALSFTVCPSEPYTGLSSGEHVLRVQARDAAQNVDPTPFEYKWVVDTAPPAAPDITWPEADAVLSTAFSEVRGMAEQGSTVDVFLGTAKVGSATANEQGVWKVAVELAVTDGRYELQAWATDAAGNKGPDPTTRTVMVDATPPDTTITDGPSGRIRTTQASFQFSASESEVTFECSLDFGPFEQCEATMTYDMPAGEHNLRVRALDQVKNEDKSPASRTWQVYLGGDSKVIGGGLSCSTTTGGSSVLATLWLLGLAVFSARRPRR
ncbi:hypothetical protein F0U60_12360 [Archangium minus]|uniref:Bacterial Ig-like domain-containing protein n=1 Tax=Archangium minus TaxID=83450 RepID=A0ABY9WME2_9BACT|nr:hypothetical protein F0U60_12360 [Archangium minus]